MRHVNFWMEREALKLRILMIDQNNQAVSFEPLVERKGKEEREAAEDNTPETGSYKTRKSTSSLTSIDEDYPESPSSEMKRGERAATATAGLNFGDVDPQCTHIIEKEEKVFASKINKKSEPDRNPESVVKYTISSPVEQHPSLSDTSGIISTATSTNDSTATSVILTAKVQAQTVPWDPSCTGNAATGSSSSHVVEFDSSAVSCEPAETAEGGKVQVIRPYPVKTAPRTAAWVATGSVTASTLVVPLPATAPAPVTTTPSRQPPQVHQAPQASEGAGVGTRHSISAENEKQSVNKSVHGEYKAEELTDNRRQEIKVSATEQMRGQANNIPTEEDAATQRKEQEAEGTKRRLAQCSFPKPLRSHQRCTHVANSSNTRMAPTGGSRSKATVPQLQQNSHGNGADRHQHSGNHNHDQQVSTKQTHRQQQQGRPSRTTRTGSSASTATIGATPSNKHKHHHPHARSISNGSMNDVDNGASQLGVVHPTPLFERMASEEVQELKSYARIIETQNRRLADLERVHGDLETRLELLQQERMDMESTLEDRERHWSSQFSKLEDDRDKWKGVVQQEQRKNARLLDQVVRKDQDIHRMLQRKVRYSCISLCY